MKLVADCHSHTLASGHAYSTIREYAEEASIKGLELIAITDHAPKMPGSAHEYYFHNLKVVPDFLYDVEVLKGIEANLIGFEGQTDTTEIPLEGFDVVIVSHHIPCLKPGSAEENTKAIIAAMNNKFVNIIGHPDDSRVPVVYDELARAAAENGVLLELNNSSLRPISFRANAEDNYLRLFEACTKYKAHLVVNSDSHIHTDIGDFQEALDLIRKTGLSKDLIVNLTTERLKKHLFQRR